LTTDVLALSEAASLRSGVLPGLFRFGFKPNQLRLQEQQNKMDPARRRRSASPASRCYFLSKATLR